MSEKCPACNTALPIKYPMNINQLVICSNCDQKLEVVWIYPLELVRIMDYQAHPPKNEKIGKLNPEK